MDGANDSSSEDDLDDDEDFDNYPIAPVGGVGEGEEVVEEVFIFYCCFWKSMKMCDFL